MKMTADFLRSDRPTLTCMVQARTGERILELIEKGLDGGADAFGVQLEQLEFKYRTKAILVKDVFPKVSQGLVKPTIYKVLPITKAEEAHDILYRGENVGKVVLKVN